MSKYYTWHDEYLEGDIDILEGLSSERIFSIKRTKKGFQVIEECDGYFGCTLSHAQMLQLIKELQILIDDKG